MRLPLRWLRVLLSGHWPRPMWCGWYCRRDGRRRLTGWSSCADSHGMCRECGDLARAALTTRGDQADDLRALARRKFGGTN